MKNENKNRLLTVTRKPGTSNDVSINIGGKWVEKAGFSIGDIVEVEVKDELIIIRKTKNKWVKKHYQIRSERYMVNEDGLTVSAKDHCNFVEDNLVNAPSI